MRFSIKFKALSIVLIIFILFIGVFSYFRYENMKDISENNIKNTNLRLKRLIGQNINSLNDFLRNRAEANLNSTGVKEALEAKSADILYNLSFGRWKILSKENSYLKQMAFFDKNCEVIAKMNKEGRFFNDFCPLNGFYLYGDEFFFANSTKYQDAGYLTFIVDANYFLDIIKSENYLDAKFIGQDSLKRFKKAEITLLDTVSNPFLSFENLYVYEDKLALMHKFDIEFLDDNGRHIVIFEDISSLNQNIKNAFYLTAIVGFCMLLGAFLVLNYAFNLLIKKLEISRRNLAFANENLKNEVRIQTQEVIRKERLMIHQNRLASMGEMLANISHQWKQPLSALSAIVTKLSVMNELNDVKQEILKQNLEKSFEIIEFMSKTINDFKSFFSKDIEKTTFSIREECDKTLELISAFLQSKSIKVQKEYLSDPCVLGYSSEFSQVILNLITNAKDAVLQNKIPNGRIKIKIQDDDEFVVVSVIDNAGGIKTAPIDKIYEPYFSTKDKKIGTGIGLYMSKVIIEQHFNGRLIARNLPRGAIFEIKLPK